MDNAPQFTAKLLLEYHRLLGIQEVFITEYYPETNRQTERYNRTLFSPIRKFIFKHPKSRYPYTDVLAYAYNAQLHQSKELPPLNWC